MTRKPLRLLVLMVSCIVLAGCNGSGADSEQTPDGQTPANQNGTNANGNARDDLATERPTVAYVTNGIASFWDVAKVGAEKGGEDFDCTVIVKFPPSGAVDQNRMVNELIALGIDGMAISPIDGQNQNQLLNEVAEHMPMITHDSDAPNSKRLCYVGMDNYAAGRMCGELAKQAMPEGGDVMIFIGRLEQDNAKYRRQGVIDELLDRDWDSSRYDDPSATLTGEKFTILGTRTDEFTVESAKRQAEDTLARYPDIDGMIGLFAYNPPGILLALEDAGRLGQIAVVGFDEADETLQAIKDGHCFGTTVQNPYMYGYESVRILAGLARGESVLPEDGFLNIEGRNITRENVDAFWADLREKMGK